MPINEIQPSREFFSQLVEAEGTTQSNLALKLSISLNTLRTLLRGKLVSRGTILHIADKLKVPIASLIEPSQDAKIPLDPAFYAKLKYGWYIDHDRHEGGLAAWHREEIRLKLSRKSAAPFTVFDGTLKNSRWGDFKLRAFILNEYQFSLMAVAESSFSGFTAGFSKCVRLTGASPEPEEILCGTWTGIDHLASRLAVYRMFLSRRELSLKDLQTLTRLTPIERVLDVDTLVKS